MNQVEVKVQLDKINLLFNVLMKDGIDNSSKLERDLLLEQIKKLHDTILAIDNELKQSPVVETPKVEETPILAKEKPTVIEIEVEESTTEDVVDEKMQEEIIAEEPAPAKLENSMEINFITEENKPQAESVNEENATSTQISEAKQDERVFSQNKPTRDLKQVIDLNKSFILRAELFNNDNMEYSNFINELSALQTEEESVKFIEHKAKEKNWDNEDKVYELLQRAVEKRFLPLIS